METVISKAAEEQPKNTCALFERLLSFLDTDEPIDSVLAGYWSKLMLILCSNKAK